MHMELILNKEACKGCKMKCNGSTDCCCTCTRKCIGRSVCPIFNFKPEVVKKKERMTRNKKIKKMFDDLINEI